MNRAVPSESPARHRPPVEPSNGLSEAEFSSGRARLLEFLAEQPGDLHWAFKPLSPEHIVVRPETQSLLSDLGRSIADAAAAVAIHYPTDSRLRALLQLDERADRLVRALSSQPLVGSGVLRPDFVLDTQGAPKICEVNARFPVNGFLLSHYLQAAVAAKENTPPPQSILDTVIPSSDILILKGEERGWDVGYFADEVRRRGFEVRYCSPLDGAIKRALDDPFFERARVVFELHQHEIAALEVDQLKALNARVLCNDLRTVLLVHDKRFLQLLRRPEILKDYIVPSAVGLLQEYVIPTFTVEHSPAIVKEALSERRRWMLKPNLLGKSEGIVVGEKVSDEQWQKALRSGAKGQYVLQPRVDGFQHPLRNGSPAQQIGRTGHVVGTILQWHAECLGPGFFRVAGGTTLKDGALSIVPAVTSEQGGNDGVQW